MNLQKRYELDLAAEKVGQEIKRTIHRRVPNENAAPSAIQQLALASHEPLRVALELCHELAKVELGAWMTDLC